MILREGGPLSLAGELSLSSCPVRRWCACGARAAPRVREGGGVGAGGGLRGPLSLSGTVAGVGQQRPHYLRQIASPHWSVSRSGEWGTAVAVAVTGLEAPAAQSRPGAQEPRRVGSSPSVPHACREQRVQPHRQAVPGTGAGSPGSCP